MKTDFGMQDGGAVAPKDGLHGTINVTRSEFAEMRRLMRGEPGCDVSEAKAVCNLLGLEFEAMAYKHWQVKVVDEVKERISAV